MTCTREGRPWAARWDAMTCMAAIVDGSGPPAPGAIPIEHPPVVPMAPQPAVAAAANDPEANIPRWRRPSVQAARFAAPNRYDGSHRKPMGFSPDPAPTTAELRVVRYAVV